MTLLTLLSNQGDGPTPTPRTDFGGGGFGYVKRPNKRSTVRQDIERALRLAVKLEDTQNQDVIDEILPIIAAAETSSGALSVSHVLENERLVESVLWHFDRLKEIMNDESEDEDFAIFILMQ